MEGEVINFICVWMTILVSLYFCHTVIGKNIPQGTSRLLALIPIICLFLWLPLNLTTMHLGSFTHFFIAWLANFKLLLFAYGKGDLINPSNRLPIPITQFVPVACFPIKISNNPSPPNLEKDANFETKDYPSSQNSEQPLKQISNKVGISPLKFATKVTMALLFTTLYVSNKDIHPQLRMSLYCLQIYFALDTALAVVAILTKTLVQVELEPQFDKPHLATSVQNFWGKRWNLMVSSILRPTVYYPLKSISTRFMIPKKWASLPAVFITFLVSGLMHELIFYYLGRLRPTGEVTCFFILQGLIVDIEIIIKKTLNGKFRLHPTVSRSYSLGFVLFSSFWLFFPPFLRINVEVKGCRDIVAFFKFLRYGKLISPHDLSCPIDI